MTLKGASGVELLRTLRERIALPESCRSSINSPDSGLLGTSLSFREDAAWLSKKVKF